MLSFDATANCSHARFKLQVEANVRYACVQPGQRLVDDCSFPAVPDTGELACFVKPAAIVILIVPMPAYLSSIVVSFSYRL